MSRSEMVDHPKAGFSRRRLLQAGVAGALGLGLQRLPGAEPSQAQETKSFRQVQLVAREGEIEPAPGQVSRTWIYNDAFPGPEIRLKEGERLRATVENLLPSGTTIHWHGIPVPNPMDGVPGLTQEPVAPGARFEYAFRAAPAGSYLYHSHVHLQLDRGLHGPLVVEETTPHVTYDRESNLILDDYLPEAPLPLELLAERQQGNGRGGMMGPGMMGRGMGPGMMGPGMMMGGFLVPPYAGLLINGRLPSAPAEFAIRRGERLRLRLFNPASATTFRVAVGGHRLTVTHADGRPVEPVTVDALFISMGERYDVLIEGGRPGLWPIVAATVEGNSPPAVALLRYAGVRGNTPEGFPPVAGRVLRLADLRALSPLPPGSPDRVFDLVLSGRSASEWTINGEIWPDAEPLQIGAGERIRFRLFNRSFMLHPMHLHGHFFQVGAAVKDTVIVPPHMGRIEFDFIADNPGRWLFHCHNLYHLEAGMAREVRYI
ncbi:multicopper oxidase family protein [Thiohalomonas denitrificans]|uniref:multicopper oxidase family protein n=1 Tax=Thiohalomonas denitrificans TaxID=415747 RepID=UPI001C31B712|nr:multicopper oxidase family protein [Thiohalomonas denitrificans]